MKEFRKRLLIFGRGRRITISTYTKQTITIAAVLLFVLVCFPFIKLNYGKQLSFSKEPGYYDSPFYLSILGGKGGTIHYTLDGSEPTVDDPVFDRKNPLYIEDATKNPNVYSMRTDTSVGFLTDLIYKYAYSGSSPNYTVPSYPVDKCTVLRASLFDSAGSCLSSITGTYFVGFQGKSIYRNIYTVSIVTSPENLFDEESGIYVTGNKFQNFIKNNYHLENGNWHLWDSNYWGCGIDWERQAYITFFDNSQNNILSQECGIRIKGGLSRTFLPKSISCFARNEYSSSNYFNNDIFMNNTLPHKIVLFGGGNDNEFKMKDYLVHTLTRNLHFSTMNFIPCAVFLDGEYWGMNYIIEDYNVEYIHNHYQIDKNNIIFVKMGYQYDGHQTYDEMISFLCQQNMATEDYYNKACSLIDIDSYIDYYATQIYLARCDDWPTGNFALWRSAEKDGSRYGDTKWRWMLFDVNSPCMDMNLLSNDTLTYVLESDPSFTSLYQNEEFRRKFAERLLYIGRETFAPEKCNQFIDQYTQTLKEPLAASNMRFYMDDKSEEFEQYVTDMRTFFEKRYDVVWDFLVQDMGEEWLAENGIQK